MKDIDKIFCIMIIILYLKAHRLNYKMIAMNIVLLPAALQGCS